MTGVIAPSLAAAVFDFESVNALVALRASVIAWAISANHKFVCLSSAEPDGDNGHSGPPVQTVATKDSRFEFENVLEITAPVNQEIQPSLVPVFLKILIKKVN